MYLHSQKNRNMKSFMIISMVASLSHCGLCESTTAEAIRQEVSSTKPAIAALLDNVDSNPRLNSLWVYSPRDHISDSLPEDALHPVFYRTPHPVTRLSKSLFQGFEPYFNRELFEPFEKRPKAISLITIRKNGFMPRSLAQNSGNEVMTVAELQSPYNNIGQFWQDEHNAR